MEREGFGQLLHLADARIDGPLAPLFEEGLHLVKGGLLPQQAQSLLEQITKQQGFVMLERFVQARQLLVLPESWGLKLSEKLEFSIMEAIEFESKERLVAKAV